MIHQEYFEKVKQYFKGDISKTWGWFNSPHRKFGVMSPLAMIRLGKENIVAKFIDDNIKGFIEG